MTKADLLAKVIANGLAEEHAFIAVDVVWKLICEALEVNDYILIVQGDKKIIAHVKNYTWWDKVLRYLFVERP